MGVNLAAFADELTKLAAAEKRRKKPTNYLASAAIGAGGLPLSELAGRAVTRGMQNHKLTRLGHSAAGMVRGPLMSKSELAGRAVAGALGGSALQWMRDTLT